MSDEIQQRLVAYLLGELPPDEHARLERELGADPALRAERDALAPVIARLAALPAEAWEALDETATPPLEPAPRPETGRPRWWRRTIALRPAAAALATLVLLAAGTGIGLLAGAGDGGAPPGAGGGAVAVAQRLPLQPIGSAGAAAGGRVAVGAGEHSARLRVRGLAQRPGHFFELWLLNPDGKMVALGAFRVDAHGDAVVRVPLPIDPRRYRYFDVSVQADSGNPAHSGISVLRGSTRF